MPEEKQQLPDPLTDEEIQGWVADNYMMLYGNGTSYRAAALACGCSKYRMKKAATAANWLRLRAFKLQGLQNFEMGVWEGKKRAVVFEQRAYTAATWDRLRTAIEALPHWLRQPGEYQHLCIAQYQRGRGTGGFFSNAAAIYEMLRLMKSTQAWKEKMYK